MKNNKKYQYAYFNYICEIKMHIEDVKLCNHSGDCESDVRRCMELPEIRTQLDKIDRESLIEELSEYGVWDIDQLQDHENNLMRILWIAAGNIKDENMTEQ